MKKLCLFLVCLASLATPALANDSPEALQNAFMTALRGHDVEGLAACYTDDAVNFPVGSLVGHGPESVKASWGGFFAAFKVVDAQLSDTHLEVHGDTAIAWGIFTINAIRLEGGDAVELVGRYMDVARDIDGSWLYVADHASMPPPPPPSAPEPPHAPSLID